MYQERLEPCDFFQIDIVIPSQCGNQKCQQAVNPEYRQSFVLANDIQANEKEWKDINGATQNVAYHQGESQKKQAGKHKRCAFQKLPANEQNAHGQQVKQPATLQ
jgi:hypothetical protein